MTINPEELASEIFSENDGFTRIYHERDVPANQWYQDLGLLLKRRMNNWERMDFEEKVRIETEITSYIGNTIRCLKAFDIPIPDFKGLNSGDLDRLNQRQLLSGVVADSRHLVERLDWGIDIAKQLWQSYHALLCQDRRISEMEREDVIKEERIPVTERLLAEIRNYGGIHSPRTGHYLVENTATMEASARSAPKNALTLVQGEREALRDYVRNYLTIEMMHSFMFHKRKLERQSLSALENDLTGYGGELTPVEQVRYHAFMQGRDATRNVGLYLSYLDHFRFMAEVIARHGRDGLLGERPYEHGRYTK